MDEKEKQERLAASAEIAGKFNMALDGDASQSAPENAPAQTPGGAPAQDNSGGEGETFPDEVFVIPNYGRPVMPSQIAPVQLTPDWESVLMKVAETKERVFAMFSLGDKPLNRELTDSDFPRIGTLVRLLHAKATSGEIHFICEGLCRVRLESWTSGKKLSRAVVSYPQTVFPQADSKQEVDVKAYAMSLVSSIQELLPLNPLYTDEMRQYLLRFNQNDPSMLADCAASITTATTAQLQHVLETLDVLERLKYSSALIRKELKAAKLQDKIKGSVTDKLNKRQRDFFLREQLSEIQKELGTKLDDRNADAQEFEKRMKKLSPPEHIAERFKEELKKMRVLETGSPEYAVTRNYLDVLTTIPWGKTAKEDIDLKKAREILDKDHEGLKDVKDRIIEFMAVGALKGSTKGSIILFAGPPGVGKTSIGKSIARALHRPFFRLSLGGVDDESVIKGHRKTYIGAMPGKLVQALRETKVMNPVIMLDEIDKLSHSYQGDPASALLETLDPEQNSGFLDHYLDEKLDLSDCLFICTANSTDTIPEALLDRMDPIRLSGYIAEEKLAIAKKHLLPRGLRDAHMRKSQLKISDAVLRKIIEEYARESGVRSLERAIAKIIRKAAVKIVGGQKSVTVRESDLEDYLGSAPFRREKSIKGVGVITGLAWTSVGGATLSIESVKVADDHKGFELTGQLGDVMKESAQIAYSYVQSNLERFAPERKNFFKKAFIHLHVPEGATPKDGPSAGVTMASSLLSLATGKAPKEGYAMTGELSLTGTVLAIGGLREKTIAARRMGIFNIICPKANEGDVKDLPDEVKNGVHYYFADKYDDVAKIIFDSALPSGKAAKSAKTAAAKRAKA
ncbi:MAG: endopeptidase La [Succinivibrio sp.]|jgi:ATP-dependent Lon protease|nr:endopeptidase La [Succinivibrio sp.]